MRGEEEVETVALAFVLDVNTELGKQDGGIVVKPFLVVYLAANLLLPGIGQPLGEDAGICYREAGHDVGRAVWQTEIISFAKEFVLIVLCFVMEEIIDRLPTAVESLNVQIGCTLRHELEIYDIHFCRMGERAMMSL